MTTKSTDRTESVRAAVNTVLDPEVPVTLADLGVVRSVDVVDDNVTILLRPTRLACPARGEMARRVKAAALSVDDSLKVRVDWEMAAWAGGDVSAQGRADLIGIGYSNPVAPEIQCPYCESRRVRAEGAFGGAVCKVPYTCEECGSTFDSLRGALSLMPVETDTENEGGH